MINTDIKINTFEMAKNIDKSDRNSSVVNIENFCDEFLINMLLLKSNSDALFSERVKAYWQQSWLCTDEEVGVLFYYLDDEFVALSVKEGRECDINFEFASADAIQKLKAFVYSLLSNGNAFISTISSDYDIDTYYNLTGKYEFMSHHEHGVYNGRPAKALPKEDVGYDENYVENLKIQYTDEDGGEDVIKITDFKIHYHSS